MEIELDQVKQNNLTKYQVIVKWEEGTNKTQISNQLEVRIIKKFEKHGSVEIDLRNNNSRPSLLSQQNKDQLQMLAQDYQINTLEDAQEMIEEEFDAEVSKSTVSRYLAELGRFVKPTQTPLLSESHLKKRLAYCRYHRDRKTSFKYVIFSDECRFYINRNTQKVFVLNNQFIPKKIKYNPDFSVMVWGALCYKGTLHLEIIEGTLNHQRYIEILDRFFTEMESRDESENWSFQQDSAPSHTPHAIELIWGWMKIQIEKKKILNKKELEQEINIVWDSIPEKHSKVN